MDDEERDEVYREFSDLVNMTPKQLARWLKTDASREVGQKESAGDESTGHRSGRRIVDLLNTNKTDLGEDDFEHMRKVTGYIKRHTAQEPGGDVEDSAWRYSLMNWGHDPLKD